VANHQPTGILLKDLLKDKFEKNGDAQMQGCHAATGEGNITRALSQTFPEITVSGSSTYSFTWKSPSGPLGLWDGTLPGTPEIHPHSAIPYTTRTYVGGVSVP